MFNHARSGSRSGRGSGLGGGIYSWHYNSSEGVFEIDAESLDGTVFNFADDRDFNDLFGDLDVS